MYIFRFTFIIIVMVAHIIRSCRVFRVCHKYFSAYFFFFISNFHTRFINFVQWLKLCTFIISSFITFKKYMELMTLMTPAYVQCSCLDATTSLLFSGFFLNFIFEFLEYFSSSSFLLFFFFLVNSGWWNMINCSMILFCTLDENFFWSKF